MIGKLKAVFKGEDYDFYDDLPEYVKQDVEQGLKDVDEGRLEDHHLVMSEFRTKYGAAD